MSLPAQLAEKLSAALALERAKVEADEGAAFDGPSRTSAKAGRTLLATHERLASEAGAAGDVDKAARVLGYIADELRIPSLVLAEAERRTFAGAVREIGGGIARDAGALAASTGRGWMALLKASPLVVVALLVLLVVRSTPRRGGG